MTRMSTRNGFPTRRRFAVWFAAFALSLQVFLPLGQAIPLPGAGGGFLVICTAFGLQRIPDPDVPPRTDERPACPVCSAQSIGSGMLAAAPIALEPVFYGRTVTAILPAAVWWEGQRPLAPSTRDPPIV